MNTFLFFFLCFGYICLLIWGIILSRNHSLFNITNVLLLVIIGLLYDNLIIASGKFIGEGNTLESLSFIRYWLHALFTTTLILFAWNVFFNTSFPWAKNTLWKVIASLMTIGLIIYELLASVKGLILEPVWKSGVLTYESMGESTSPFMVILITIVLGIVGILLIMKFRFFWLFIGTIVMTAGSILAIWIKISPIMNVSEFLLLVSTLLTKQFIIKLPDNHVD